MDKPKVLYFIFGNPSADQMKLARESGAVMRNAETTSSSDYIEPCDSVMGRVPAAYESVDLHENHKKALQLASKSSGNSGKAAKDDG